MAVIEGAMVDKEKGGVVVCGGVKSSGWRAPPEPRREAPEKSRQQAYCQYFFDYRMIHPSLKQTFSSFSPYRTLLIFP